MEICRKNEKVTWWRIIRNCTVVSDICQGRFGFSICINGKLRSQFTFNTYETRWRFSNAPDYIIDFSIAKLPRKEFLKTVVSYTHCDILYPRIIHRGLPWLSGAIRKGHWVRETLGYHLGTLGRHLAHFMYVFQSALVYKTQHYVPHKFVGARNYSRSCRESAEDACTRNRLHVTCQLLPWDKEDDHPTMHFHHVVHHHHSSRVSKFQYFKWYHRIYAWRFMIFSLAYTSASLLSTAFVLLWQSSVVGRARKRAGIKYPQGGFSTFLIICCRVLYHAAFAEKAEVEASRESLIFNCAQRAHLNTLENIPFILITQVVSFQFFLPKLKLEVV